MDHHNQFNLRKFISRKAVVILLSIISVAAFATLGDGKKSNKTGKSLLTNKTGLTNGKFTLKSGYTFRGTQVISQKGQSYINTNTVVSFRKGHTTYVLPLKNKVILEKVTFNPNSSTRKTF